MDKDMAPSIIPLFHSCNFVFRVRFRWMSPFCLLVCLFLTGCFQNPDVLYRRAVKLIEENRLGRAEKILFRVLELQPRHQDGVYSLGVLYLKRAL